MLLLGEWGGLGSCHSAGIEECHWGGSSCACSVPLQFVCLWTDCRALYGSWVMGEVKAQQWERQWGGIGFAPLAVKAASCCEDGCRAILGAFGNGVGSQRPAGLFGDDPCPAVSALWHTEHTQCCSALIHLQIAARLHCGAAAAGALLPPPSSAPLPGDGRKPTGLSGAAWCPHVQLSAACQALMQCHPVSSPTLMFALLSCGWCLAALCPPSGAHLPPCHPPAPPAPALAEAAWSDPHPAAVSSCSQ